MYIFLQEQWEKLLSRLTWVCPTDPQQSQTTDSGVVVKKKKKKKVQHFLQGAKQEELVANAQKTWIPQWLSGKDF